MKKCKKESRPDKPAHSFQAANLHLRRRRTLLRYHPVCAEILHLPAPRAHLFSEAHQSVLQLPRPKTETMREAAAAIALLLLVASSINGEGTILKF
jgi:hypothetical protein